MGGLHFILILVRVITNNRNYYFFAQWTYGKLLVCNVDVGLA